MPAVPLTPAVSLLAIGLLPAAFATVAAMLAMTALAWILFTTIWDDICSRTRRPGSTERTRDLYL